MIDNKALCEKTAERLKKLRKNNNLSHQKLSEELKKRYGITISKSSLINYEVADDYYSKSGSNAGMRIEYVRCLADFYGVSADYILGLSDKKTPDVNAQAAMDYTGLSEDSITFLNSLKTIGIENELTSVIDNLIFDFRYATAGESVAPLAFLIYWYLNYKGNGKIDKMVHFNGQILDCNDPDGFISSSIKLNDRIIESAALTEIQQALISLKKRLLQKEDRNNGKY